MPPDNPHGAPAMKGEGVMEVTVLGEREVIVETFWLTERKFTLKYNY